MKILLDSCIWGGVKANLESVNHDVKWVGDFLTDPGDSVIIQLAFSEKRILITLDKDFGELAVFRGIPHCGIIRLVGFSGVEQGSISAQIVEKYRAELSQNAILTVEPTRVRVRLFP